MNEYDLFTIQYVLEEHWFDKSVCFVLYNYIDVMRKYDIKFKSLENTEAEIKGCNVVFYSYAKLFKNSAV